MAKRVDFNFFWTSTWTEVKSAPCLRIPNRIWWLLSWHASLGLFLPFHFVIDTGLGQFGITKRHYTACVRRGPIPELSRQRLVDHYGWEGARFPLVSQWPLSLRYHRKSFNPGLLFVFPSDLLSISNPVSRKVNLLFTPPPCTEVARWLVICVLCGAVRHNASAAVVSFSLIWFGHSWFGNGLGGNLHHVPW